MREGEREGEREGGRERGREGGSKGGRGWSVTTILRDTTLATYHTYQMTQKHSTADHSVSSCTAVPCHYTGFQ